MHTIDETWISVDKEVPPEYEIVMVRCIDSTNSNHFEKFSLGWVYDSRYGDYSQYFPRPSNAVERIEQMMVYTHHPSFEEARKKYVPKWVWRTKINPLIGLDAHRYTVTHWKSFQIC